jgi:PDZ domain-containing protein
MIRRSNHLRFSRTPRLLRAFLILVSVVALLAPMNFVLVSPGPASPLFPKILSIKEAGVSTYPVHGNLYLLTIFVTNPETRVFGAEVVGCWVWGDCAVLPRSVMYKDGTTDEKATSEGSKEMSTSQNIALAAAKKFVALNFPSINVSALKNSSVKVSLENTGGPSGGLIFTLGLIDLLTPIDIVQGRKIAGTGTIALDGTIGAIGGVAEKILGAKKAGASILFVSTENCSELPADTSGVTVIAVHTIDQVVDYLVSNPAQTGFNSAGIRGLSLIHI